MATEAPEAVSNLSSTMERLRSDLENVQRELDQALSVWRQTLISEKRDFQTSLQSRQAAWDEQDAQWQHQRQAYEEKIAGLESAFQNRLATAEQNALRALNDLDDAWQRDKLVWTNAQTSRLRELESRDAAWQAEQERMKVQIQDLEAQLAQASAIPVQTSENNAAVQEVREGWERDRRVWEDSVRQTLQELHEREAAWQAERSEQAALLERLQNSVRALEGRITIPEGRPVSRLVLEAFLIALEDQVDLISSLLGPERLGAHR